MDEKVCVVAGVGPGNGAAFSRRFAEAGWRVAMLARSESTLRELESTIPGTQGFAVDVTDAGGLADAFARIRSELGAVRVYLHNAGSGVFGGFLDAEPEAFEKAWRVNTLSLVLAGKQVVPAMLEAGEGAIIVTGATASLRGGAAFAVFAQAKAAQRSLAQSMARSLWPQGIHVAYAVVDGVIDIPRTRSLFKDRPDAFFLRPESIADSIYHLATQDRSAWTFELDLRPFGEKW